MLTATVSGSFHRHFAGIYAAVGELREAGIAVLSPSDPRIVDHLGEFLFVASDRVRSIRLVQDRHLGCIKASTFLWLVAPDGYVGSSAAMEIGYAVAKETPIYSTTEPNDATLKQYVQMVPNVRDAILRAKARNDSRSTRQTLLLDPFSSIDGAMSHLDNLRTNFSSSHLCKSNSIAQQIESTKDYLVHIFDL